MDIKNRQAKRVKKHKFYGDVDRQKKLRALSINGMKRATHN